MCIAKHLERYQVPSGATTVSLTAEMAAFVSQFITTPHHVEFVNITDGDPDTFENTPELLLCVRSLNPTPLKLQ